MSTSLQPSIASASCSVPSSCEQTVRIRRFPYPYRAALAICSDLDETPDRHVYWEMMRFLNTTETTAMGPGVGLEVGNTIYFDMDPDQFAYWNTDDAGREMVRNLIHSGHIDCLHSFGDRATTRAHAQRALDELIRYDCRIEVWVDHSKAPTNFGPDIMVGSGDLPGSVAYHADLTSSYGIKYVWRGRTTSVIGQNVPPSLRGLFNARHPLRSGRTVAKQAIKIQLGRLGNRKYRMHAPNQLLGTQSPRKGAAPLRGGVVGHSDLSSVDVHDHGTEDTAHRAVAPRCVSLRDGHRVWEFLRCNPHWRGVGEGATAAGLAEVLTTSFLDRLVAREGACILYTHLGKIANPDEPFTPPVVEALRRLARYQHSGRLLVTTTRRLLGLVHAACQIAVTQRPTRDGLRIEVDTTAAAKEGHSPPARGDIPPSRCDYEGMTFYVDNPLQGGCVSLQGGCVPERVSVQLDGQPVSNLRRNGPDHTGKQSVSIPWHSLVWPK